MKITDKHLEAQNLIQNLNKEALKNELFKKKLIQNPEKAIEEFSGKATYLENSHGGSKIFVEDQTDPSIMYLNIPVMPDIDSFELSDSELESVSGGCTPSTYFVVFIAAASLGYITKE